MSSPCTVWLRYRYLVETEMVLSLTLTNLELTNPELPLKLCTVESPMQGLGLELRLG